MAYEKTNWQAGDVITAEKLNHLEGGVEEAANKPVFAPEIVTGEGDISITYNGNQIGVLSDSGTLTLETKDTICEDDIEVEYNKPYTGVSLPEVIVSSSVEVIVSDGISGKMLYETDNKILSSLRGAIATKKYLVPKYDTEIGLYIADIEISRDADDLNVTINNTIVPYDSDSELYHYRYSSVNYPEGFTVVITNKE